MADLGVESRIFTTDMAGPPSAKRRRVVATGDLPIVARALDVTFGSVRWPRRFAYAPSMRTALREATREADLVNIHSLFLYPQYVAWRAAVAAGTPYIVTVHGALDPYLRRRGRLRKRVIADLWQSKMLDGAAALQLATEHEAAMITDIAPDVERIVVPIGIHAAAFRQLPTAASFRERRLEGHDGAIVLALGRLSRVKGLDVLVRAFAGLASRHPDAILVLAGPDDEGIEPMLRSLAQRLGVEDKVFFTGMLLPEERLEVLAAATLWALPSHTENFAIAALEALAAGLPVIVSPAVDLSRALEQHRAAVVTEASPEAFERSMDELLSHPGRRLELGAAGREFALRYDWSRVAAETLETYEELLSRNSPNSRSGQTQ